MKKLLNLRNSKHKATFAFIAVSLMILVGFISVWNEQALSSSNLSNPLPNYTCKAVPFNLNNNSDINGNLTIISKGLINGSAWTASIEDKNYTTNQSVLKISLPIGNYSIKFYSSERYGQSRTINLNASGISITENFYRMVNLSCSLNSFSDPFHVESAGNLTVVMNHNCVELFNHSRGLSRQFIPISQCCVQYFSGIGWNGSYFIFGGKCMNKNGIGLVSFNPYGEYLNVNGQKPFSGHYVSSTLAGYSLNSMSVGENEVFISGTRESGGSYNIFGILNLTSWKYTNVTGEFSITNDSRVKSCYGNGTFIVEIGNEWYILNGKSLKVEQISEIATYFSPTVCDNENSINVKYLVSNGTAFFIGNNTRIVCYNPEKNLTKCVYSVSNSLHISLIYANATAVLAGIYNSYGNFSIATISSKTKQVPFFESTNANKIIGPDITDITTYGNNIIFIGCNLSGKGGSLYIFTNVPFGITFREYGLPPGVQWNVQIGKLLIITTNSCITIDNLSSGLYYYFIGTPSNFNSSVQTGRFCYVSGIPINVFVSFNLRFSFVIKNITMNPEYGELRITLNGLNLTNMGCTFLYYLPNGPTSRIEVSANLMYGKYSYYAIYTQSFTKAISGYICVDQNCSYKVLNFVRAISTVSFNMENNISNQYCWKVDASSVSFFSNEPGSLSYRYNKTTLKGFGKENLSVELRDGCYQYTIVMPSNKYGQNGHNNIFGTLNINGSNFTINITFQKKYPVYIDETGIHGFHIGSFIMLPPWSFAIYKTDGNGSVLTSGSNILDQSYSCVCLSNGTYVGEATECEEQYNTVTHNQTFVVNGSSINVSFHFVPYTYSVSVNEMGLNGPYKWYVNSTFGNYCGMAGRPITIYEINGTFTFTVTTNTKTYISQQYTYSGCLWGITKTYNVTFVISDKVKVVESGIPQGFKWYLNLTNQRSLCSYNSSVIVYYPAGKFDFSADSWGNLYSSYLMKSHTFTVANNSVLYLTFRPYNYSIYYKAEYSGNVDYNYSFIIDGGYLHSHEIFYSNASLDAVIHLINGTYNYTVVSSNNAFRNITGTLYVQGYSYYGMLLHFRLFLFNETFIETGLESKVNWSIAIGGENGSVYHLSATGSQTMFELHNGTYYLTVNTLAGNYYSNTINTTYIINSNNPVIHIRFYIIEGLYSQLLNLYGNIGISQYFSFLFVGIITGASGLTYFWKKRTDI